MNCTGDKFCLTEEKLGKSLNKYNLYVLQGLVLAFTNLPVVAAIFRQKCLRSQKEYLLPAGMLFVNGMMGIAGIVGGGLRSYYIVIGTANHKRSKWQCFCTIFQHLWTWVDFLNPFSLALISADRLLAILMPLQYYGFGKMYAYCMYAIGLGFTGLWYLAAASQVYTYQEPLYPQICSQDYSHAPPMYQFLQSCRFIFVAVSIGLFPIVIIFFRRQSKKVNPMNTTKSRNRQEEQRKKREQKLTMSLGISSLITFIFFFIPQLIDLWGSLMFSFEMINDIGPILSLMYRMDPLADMFIFTLRHSEIRLALVYLFKCKELTQSRIDNISTKGQQKTGTNKKDHNTKSVVGAAPPDEAEHDGVMVL